MKHLPLIALLTAVPAGAFAQDTAATMTAALSGTDGTDHGTVTAEMTESGMMLVTLDLTGVPGGVHGVHIHETGDCSAADFSSAGGHLAGDDDNTHGIRSDDGPHDGDLPNVTVPDDGVLKVEFFNDELEMEDLTDADGAAFIVHSGVDDYTSQPAGDAGDRIACGVFE